MLLRGGGRGVALELEPPVDSKRRHGQISLKNLRWVEVSRVPQTRKRRCLVVGELWLEAGEKRLTQDVVNEQVERQESLPQRGLDLCAYNCYPVVVRMYVSGLKLSTQRCRRSGRPGEARARRERTKPKG